MPAKKTATASKASGKVAAKETAKAKPSPKNIKTPKKEAAPSKIAAISKPSLKDKLTGGLVKAAAHMVKAATKVATSKGKTKDVPLTDAVENPKTAKPKKPADPVVLDSVSVAPKETKKVSKKKSSKIVPKTPEEIEAGDEQWQQLYRQHKNEATVPYHMESDYKPKMAIEHKILGWGYILKAINNRIEVSFKAGVKTLIMNHKN